MELLNRVPQHTRTFLKRNARTMFTLEISALASLLAYGSPMALPITLGGAVAVAIVGMVTSERESRARERAQRDLEEVRVREAAALEPIRRMSVHHVAEAAFELIRSRLVYRDVAAARPRQAHISILDIVRGENPEAGWNATEARAIQTGIERLGRQYEAAIGAPLGELGLDVRGAALEIKSQLREAEDALDLVAMAADNCITAEVGHDEERRLRRRELNETVAALRTYLRAIVAHAKSLYRAEQIALGQVPDEPNEPTQNGGVD